MMSPVRKGMHSDGAGFELDAVRVGQGGAAGPAADHRREPVPLQMPPGEPAHAPFAHARNHHRHVQRPEPAGFGSGFETPAQAYGRSGH